jgi:ABC-type sugar transport system substrate-binding protein
MARRARPSFRLTLLTALALLLPALPGCKDGSDRGGAGREKRLVIGYSAVVSWGGWNGANAQSIRDAAAAANMELRVVDSNYRQEDQVAALRSFVKQRVDVIILAPLLESGWDLVLNEVRSAGIPVILMDRAIEVSDDSLYASLIGSDFVEEGRRAGRWLLAHAPDVKGEIGIVELQGTVGSAPANDRKLGFSDVISADPRLRIIRSQSADFERGKARELMAEFLKSQGRRIRVVFTHSDTMAFGAIEAIEAAGLKPGSDILIVSIEGKREALEAIIAGKLNVTVECSPLLGPPLIAVVKDLAAGKPVPRRVITRESVFTIENAAAELPNRAY